MGQMWGIKPLISESFNSKWPISRKDGLARRRKKALIGGKRGPVTLSKMSKKRSLKSLIRLRYKDLGCIN